jgi:hypothetical protein
VDERAQVPRGADQPADSGGVLGRQAVPHRPPLEELRLAEQRGQGRAQVVGGRHEEVVLEARGLFAGADAGRLG